MNERTRNRIIGGVLVVSLLIIIVPMLFDRPLDIELDIPPMETVEVDESLAPDIDLPDTRDVLQVRKNITAEVDEEGFRRQEETHVGEPVLTFNAKDAEQWAVQLASFGIEESASDLRESLESDGHRVWISTATVNNNKVHRVVVGPFIKREDADSRMEQFERSYELSPIVVGFDY